MKNPPVTVPYQTYIKLEKDALRYQKFREFIKHNSLYAQGIVWNSSGSRSKFDQLVDRIPE